MLWCPLLLLVTAAAVVEDAGAKKTACAAAAMSDGTFLGICGVVVAVIEAGGTVEVVGGAPAEEGAVLGGGRTRLNFFAAFPEEGVFTSSDGSTVDMSESSDNFTGVCPSIVLYE